MTQDGRLGPEDDEIGFLAQSIAARGWTTPVVLALELLKPFGFLGSQAWLLAEPLLGCRGRTLGRRYAMLVEDRSNIERLIECLEGERHAQE